MAQADAVQIVQAAATIARGRYPALKVRELSVEGRPGTVLATAALGCGLLVVSSRGRGGFAGLVLGSVSHDVIHSAPCPVAVVRQNASQLLARS